MAAKDLFHYSVRTALEKDAWMITDDPLKLKIGGVRFEIDLAAERLIAAERDNEKIAIEVKGFLSNSPVTDFHAALGQFLSYRLALKSEAPDRTLYLAIPLDAFESFFQEEFIQDAIQTYQIKLIVYDPRGEVIVTWLK